MQAGGKHSQVNLSNEITGLVQKPTKNEEHSLSVWEQSIEWAAAHCGEWGLPGIFTNDSWYVSGNE